MPSLIYGTSSYKRADGNFPPLQLINMFAEQAKTSENNLAIMSRPGLGLLSTVGSGPIVGIYGKKGTFNGDVFSISSTTLYRGTTSLGPVAFAGSGAVSWGGSDNELLVTRAATARSYNGTTLANVTFPDTAPVQALTFIGERFVAVRGGASLNGRFYWSNLLDGRTWDALNYATAEREPDALLDVEALGNAIWLFGQQTVEAWAYTGDANLPFSRVESIAFDKGIFSTGAVVRADNSLIFVASNRCVYRVGDVPERISDNSVEERIAKSATCSVFAFARHGHEFVAVRLAVETLIYDCSTQSWSEYQSSGGQWIVRCSAMVDHLGYFGHQTAGQIMGWSDWDDMGSPLERRFTAYAPLDYVTPIDRLYLWVNGGQGDISLTDEPVIEMRLSEDAGITWGDWDPEGLGFDGNYRCVPEWRALGEFDPPGVIAEFRVTDPVPLRVSAVKINDTGGGKARDG